MGPGIKVREDSSHTMRILGLPVGLLAILFNCLPEKTNESGKDGTNDDTS